MRYDCLQGGRPPSRGEGKDRVSGSRLGLQIQRLIRVAPKGLQGIPLADGAQRLAAGQPLVYALQVKPVLAGQHPQLLPFPTLQVLQGSRFRPETCRAFQLWKQRVGAPGGLLTYKCTCTCRAVLPASPLAYIHCL